MDPSDEILSLVREIRSDQIKTMEMQKRAISTIKRARIALAIFIFMGIALMVWSLLSK
jgi:hypothetical protein